MFEEKIFYLVLLILAFVVGTQVDINFKTSQVFTSDVIAVVNNDQKTLYMEEEIKMGDDFIQQLENIDSDYQFQTTSGAEASQGLTSGKYGATIIVPSNFTTSILSVNSESPLSTNIVYSLNDKLPPSASNKMEKTIVENISTFEDNITYMFMYSIFSELHTTQESVGVVGDNTTPIYDFLEEVNKVDIVANHDYKLAENNSDSFAIIDISAQLKKFGETVSKYKTEVTQVIDVYKQENKTFGSAVDENIAIMDENDQLLNERINNVEDTLNTVVKDNKAFTEDDYSITGAKPYLKLIIEQYLNQLKSINSSLQLNQQSIFDAEQVNNNLSELNDDKYFQAISEFVGLRSSYYSSLDKIVNECLSADQSTASICISNNISTYENQYSNYEQFKQQFETEQDYYDAMTYYLKNISEPTAEVKTESKNIPLTIQYDNTKDVKNNRTIQQQTVMPTFEVLNYGQNLSKTNSSANNIIGLELKNVTNVNEVTIDIINSTNLLAIKPVSTSNDNSTVTSKDDKIIIDEITGSTLALQFEVEKQDESLPTTIKFSLAGDTKEITIDKKNRLTVNSQVNPADSSLVLDFEYQVQSTIEDVRYTNSKIFEKYGSDNVIVAGNDQQDIRLTSDGFVISKDNLQPGETISFQIVIKDIRGEQVTVETFKVGEEQLSYPIVNQNPIVSTDVQISDDPYTLDGSKVVHNNDDSINNQEMEVGETVGINYNLRFQAKQEATISRIKFTLNFESVETKLLPSEIIVMNGDEQLEHQATIKGNEVTIDFIDDIKLGKTKNRSNQYHSDLRIYLNSDVISATNGLGAEVTIENLQVDANHIEIQTMNQASTDFTIATGNPILTTVDYIVGTASCGNEEEINACQFEGGDEFVKNITITNDSKLSAPSLLLSDVIDKSELVEIEKMEYKLIAINGNSKTNFALDAKEYIKEGVGGTINFSLPANSKLVISQSLKITDNITTPSSFTNEIGLNQFQSNKGDSKATIKVVPLPISISINDSEQVVEDGVITPNEAIKLQIEVRNNSLEASSTNQTIKLSELFGTAVSSIKVLGIEDENWNSIKYTMPDARTITVKKALAPNQAYVITLRVNFNDLSSAVTNETLKFSINGTYATDSISYNLAIDPDYLQLAIDQAQNGKVINDETFKESLDNTNGLREKVDDLKSNIKMIVDNIQLVNGQIDIIDNMTILSNEQIDTILQQLEKYDLGYESQDDDSELAEYEYCVDNDEVSCQIFNVYNLIATKESSSKTNLLDILNTINPKIEEQLGTKPSENTEKQPTNVGADFNGYGPCEPIVDEVSSENNEEKCELLEPGINTRIKQQGANVDTLEESINKILDNETKEVNEEPYKQQLNEINEETNKVMDKVESENNQLFDKKIDIYNENYQAVIDYIQEISEDPTYQDAIKDFTKEEKTRQKETLQILESVYNILPNTNLEGIPNKLVYSFIANPFESTQVKNEKSEVVTASNSNHTWIIFFVIGMFALSGLLFGLLYYINRGV